MHPARQRHHRDRTFGDRAADVLRLGMGSWPFVFCFLGFMVAWAVGNTIVMGHEWHRHSFDPYPYILLNLFLSMLAGLQGAILLIAAKRSDRIAAEQADHDYAVNKAAIRVLRRIAVQAGVDIEPELADVLHLLEETV